jgi:hypothetical protein
MHRKNHKENIMPYRRILKRILLLGILLPAFGCGGSGAVPQSRAVTGYASKGIIANGLVLAYATDSAGQKTLPALAQAATDSSGFYTLSVGSYYGPLTVEVTGNYRDEATGRTATIDSTAPLTAALVPPADATPINVNVTALTRLAYDLALSTPGTFSSTINATNHKVSSSFQVPDILTTRPLDSSSTLPANASADEIKYTLVLAAVSQIAANSLPGGTTAPSSQQLASALTDALATLTGKLPTSGSAAALQETVATAATQFIANTAFNTTGISAADPAVQPILAASRRNITITVALGHSTLPVPSFGAVHGTLLTPTGLDCQANSASGALPDAVLHAAQNGSLLSGNFNAGASLLTLQAIRPGGLALGDVLSVSCSVPAGVTVAAGDFTVNDETLDVNNGGVTLTGFRLQVAVSGN